MKVSSVVPRLLTHPTLKISLKDLPVPKLQSTRSLQIQVHVLLQLAINLVVDDSHLAFFFDFVDVERGWLSVLERGPFQHIIYYTQVSMYEEQYLQLNHLEAQSAPELDIDRTDISYHRLPSFASEPVEGAHLTENQQGFYAYNFQPQYQPGIPPMPGDNLPADIIVVNIVDQGPVQEIGIYTVITESPFVTLNRPDLQEGFMEMLVNLLAPRYKFVSVTTILALLPLVMYIVLSFTNRPPFLKLSYFSVESVNLTPYRLKQFEFYRLYSAPFVFNDLNETLMNCLLTWIVGSNVEDIFGWKIISAVIGFPGLVGASTNICFFLLGMHTAFMLIEWPNPNTALVIRRVQITIYGIMTLLFFLLLLTQERVSRVAIFSSTMYGFLLGFMVRMKSDREPTSFRKLAKFMSTTILIMATTAMLFSLVLSKKTIL